MTEIVLYDHVTQLMKDIADKYFLYVADWDDVFPIVFGDETITMNEGGKDEYSERMQDVSFDTGDIVYTVTNEYCFHELEEARQAAKELHEIRGYTTTVLGFRHGGSDMARAVSIELSPIIVNKLGYGVFVEIEAAMEQIFTLSLPQMRFIIDRYVNYIRDLIAEDVYVEMNQHTGDLVIREKETDFYNRKNTIDIITHDYFTIHTITQAGTCTTTTEGRVFKPPEGYVASFPHRHASSVINHTGGEGDPDDPPTSEESK